ncbi:ABC transporter permease [Glaesserella sp.]|uniref:ABC transporter permease n=1 Tax=Glaesserella sp. TaxID=2094731 RepID=UPI0035A0591B
MRFTLLSKLVIKDLINDKKVSFFIVSALIAVISPLLLLFSLKFGIISKLQEDLLKDPTNLEVAIQGLGQDLDNTWFERMEKDPNIAFVIPLTRSASMEIKVRNKMSRKGLDSLTLKPTKTGDPLIPATMPLKSDGIILSESAAAVNQLNAKVGDEITLIVQREVNQVAEEVKVDLTVEGILDARYYNKSEAFISLPLLIAIEDYKDGADSVIEQAKSHPQAVRSRDNFPKARIYAKDLDSVENVDKLLRKQNIMPLSQVKAIENVKAIDRTLSVLFYVISATSIIGAILSLSGSFLANIDRKRKDISLMNLFGFQHQELRLYLIIQSLILASLACLASFGLYFISSAILNNVFSHNLSDQYISTLLTKHFIIAFFFTNLTACIVAIIGSMQIIKIQPAEVLREA